MKEEESRARGKGQRAERELTRALGAKEEIPEQQGFLLHFETITLVAYGD